MINADLRNAAVKDS